MPATSLASANPWLVCPQPQPAARLRLFCFPYAGGGASIYHSWAAHLRPGIEVWAVQLPGRQNRILEAPFTSMPALIAALGSALAPALDRPFVFFGHSMGAITAFEMARALRRQGRPGPLALCVAAHRAPQLPSLYPATYPLPDAAFVAELQRLNGTPAELLDNPEIIELMLPLLRADFTLAETYEYVPEEPLDCPIAAFGGVGDSRISSDEIAAWQAQTHRACVTHMLPGDHFFLESARPAVLAALHADLACWQTR